MLRLGPGLGPGPGRAGASLLTCLGRALGRRRGRLGRARPGVVLRDGVVPDRARRLPAAGRPRPQGGLLGRLGPAQHPAPTAGLQALQVRAPGRAPRGLRAGGPFWGRGFGLGGAGLRGLGRPAWQGQGRSERSGQLGPGIQTRSTAPGPRTYRSLRHPALGPGWAPRTRAASCVRGPGPRPPPLTWPPPVPGRPVPGASRWFPKPARTPSPSPARTQGWSRHDAKEAESCPELPAPPVPQFPPPRTRAVSWSCLLSSMCPGAAAPPRPLQTPLRLREPRPGPGPLPLLASTPPARLGPAPASCRPRPPPGPLQPAVLASPTGRRITVRAPLPPSSACPDGTPARPGSAGKGRPWPLCSLHALGPRAGSRSRPAGPSCAPGRPKPAPSRPTPAVPSWAVCPRLTALLGVRLFPGKLLAAPQAGEGLPEQRLGHAGARRAECAPRARRKRIPGMLGKNFFFSLPFPRPEQAMLGDVVAWAGGRDPGMWARPGAAPAGGDWNFARVQRQPRLITDSGFPWLPRVGLSHIWWPHWPVPADSRGV